jgi:hypothetical protein
VTRQVPTGRATRRAAHRDDDDDDDDDDARAMEMTGTRAHIAQRLVSARPTRRATTPMTNGTRMQRLSRPRAAFARVVATLAIGDVAADVGGSSMSRAVAAREVMARARGGDALRVTLARAGEDGTGCYLECASDARVLDDGSVFVRGYARGVCVVLVCDGASGRVTLREEDDGRAKGGRRVATASSEAFARAYDGWVTLLDGLARAGTYPAPGIDGGVDVETVSKLCDFDELRARVERDASFWADGSPVDFSGISADQRATLNAGEILAFACGKRPMCMVQLWSGWNAHCAIDQNVDKPFVMRLLKDMSEDGDVGIVTIAVPGGTEEHGLTALMYPNKSPYKERAKFLASIGVQAALVAGSPYYQTLIGRVLGYKEENIDAHVRQYSKGVGVSKAISDLVEEELAGLSSVKVEHRARWRQGYESSQPKSSRDRRGPRKKRSSSANVEDVEMMFGRRRAPR